MGWQGTNVLILGHYHLQPENQLLPSQLDFWYLQLSLPPSAGASWHLLLYMQEDMEGEGR